MSLPYHLVMGTYGFWLPNDPRGSWSHFVGSWELLQYGKVTTVESTQSHARLEHDRALRQAATNALKYPPVVLDGYQARAAAMGIGRYVSRTGLPIMACAILPQHIHLILVHEPSKIRRVVIGLKAAMTHELIEQGIHPQKAFVSPSGRFPRSFARGCWLLCLEEDEVLQAIDYVQQNPVKEGKKAQRWSFVDHMRMGEPSAPQ